LTFDVLNKKYAKLAKNMEPIIAKNIALIDIIQNKKSKTF
jgi:hypothetical protein